MSDDSSRIFRLKEQLAEEVAEVMLLAARKEAGMFLSTEDFYKAKSQLMDVISGWILQ